MFTLHNIADQLQGWRLTEQCYITRSRSKTEIYQYPDQQEEIIRGDTADKDDSGPLSEAPPNPSGNSHRDPQKYRGLISDSKSDFTESFRLSVHPRSRLNHGKVLVIDRGDRTELLTPTDVDTDPPYYSRTIDDDTVNVWKKTELSESEVQHRLSLKYERTELDRHPDPTASHATGVRA